MDHITEAQIQFGMRVGADLRGKSVGVARAMIDDAIEGQFHGPNDLGQATARQIELANHYKLPVSIHTRESFEETYLMLLATKKEQPCGVFQEMASSTSTPMPVASRFPQLKRFTV